MTPDTQVLWERLRAFDFDRGPAAFTFRDRLARDTGWPRARAGRVIAEHRRFLLLAGAAGHPVSPSADVDEAWHLHLTYTRSYAIVRKPAWWPPTRAVAVTSLLLAAGVTSACVAEAFVVGGFVAIGALVMLAVEEQRLRPRRQLRRRLQRRGWRR